MDRKFIETPKRDDSLVLREEYRDSSNMEVKVVALSEPVTAIRSNVWHDKAYSC